MRRTQLALAAAVVLAACGGGGGGKDAGNGYYPTTPSSPSTPNTPVTPPANTVLATDQSTFNPTTLTVPRNTTVTFSFGGIAHDVTFSGAGAPANIPATSGQSVQRTFSTQGSYSYYCSIHGSYMSGTITVQ